MGLTNSKETKVLVDGYCHKNYQPVKERLEDMLHNGKEENVQLCVYVDEKCVVDLYGTAIGDTSYNAESIQTIFSSGKSIESIAMGILYGKGLFKYEDPIAKHWPAFAQNGKENVSIADVFRHQGGLAWFTETFPTVKDMWTENIKKNKVGQLIEKQKLHYPSDTIKAEYHAITRGLIINEIVRRLDTKGRTIGDIIKEDFNVKGIYLGSSLEPNTNPVPQTFISKSFIIKQCLTPEWMGKRISMTFSDLVSLAKTFATRDKQLEEHPPVVEEMKGIAIGQDFVNIFNSPDFNSAEICSANCRGNARGMAKLASIMANKGQGLMTLDAWNEMHSEATFSPTGIAQDTVHFNFTKGGVNYFANSPDATIPDKEKLNKNREGYYGWFGFGGSIMQWHPELRIGFGFAVTFLNITEIFNMRGAVLQRIVKDCAQKEKE